MLFKLCLIICAQLFLESSYVNGASCQPTPCNYRAGGVSSDEKREILDEHNKYRAKIANGEEGDFPQAANMMQLAWDDNLQKTAQEQADGCIYKHSKPECRKNSRWEWVGENTRVSESSALSNTANWKATVYAWYKEERYYPASQINSFSSDAGNGEKIGHFTQVIWATTQRVGCGFTAYNNTGRDPRVKSKWPFVQLYVCNYGPGGNYDQTPIYDTGAPCSECTDGGCGEIQGLCAPQ